MNWRCGIVLAIAILTCSFASAGDEPKIQADVIYGRKDGMALTFDVITPAKANGGAVLWIQSGGWYSVWNEPKKLLPGCQPFLAKGLTVFIVRHASAPKYTVPEAVEDVRRCVRFIHWKAKDFGVDANRLGTLGGSAGGHLSLMLATTGDDGNPNAKDEVLKHSSKIAAAVALFPPTDLRNWTTDPPPAIKKIPGLKPPLTFDEKKTPDVSPLLHVSADDAPILLIHGDKDELVPIEHSDNMIAALKKANVPSELLVIKGATHSFTADDNKIALPAMVNWFEKHLAAKKAS